MFFPNLTIPATAWTAIGPPGAEHTVLLTCVWIGGVGHHLSAYQVATVDGIQTLVDPDSEAEVMPALQALYEGAYQSVVLPTPTGSANYVLVLYPYTN